MGRDAGSTPALLRDALREASWSARDDRHVLAHACPHPVVDFVLRDLVERADTVLKRTWARFNTAPHGPFVLLRHLPRRLSADDVRPARAVKGRPLYALPHVRFRLDHNRIRELLMGAQLYSKPTLAIRELYQNALDACRYRRARGEYLERTGHPAHQPYEGRITFRQDVDERGRTYIECADNGVGMTRNVLERVFSVAGRRFHDMPDFIEERAAWQRCKPPIELYPNSQFGIGVLSYFMLADEVTVWTRRYEADGSLGEPLVVHISSASGLFRLEEGREEEMQEAGTRLRLYLASTKYKPEYGDEKPISCLSTLGELLLVAEFATSAEQGGEWLVWKPGELTQHHWSDRARRLIRATKDLDVWWCAGGQGLLLCDGLATETEHSCLIANLRGSHSPEMSVDRQKVLKYDEAWLDRVIEESWESWQALLGWADLEFYPLWALERVSVCSARKVVEFINQQISSLWYRHNVTLLKSRNLISFKVVGCCVIDAAVIDNYELKVATRLRLDITSCPIVYAWRLMSWAKVGVVTLPDDWPSSSLLDEAHGLVAVPGDATLLSRSLGTNRGWPLIDHHNGWIEGEVPVPHIFGAVFRVGLKPSEVLRRITELAPLGIRPPPVDTSVLDRLEITKNDLCLLSRNLDGVYPWVQGEVPPGHIMKASQRMNITPGKLIERLRYLIPLGVKPPRVEGPALDELAVTEVDLRLLSRNLGGTAPWHKVDISPLHILRAASELHVPARSILDQLAQFAPLGIRVPEIDANSVDAFKPTNDELRLLSWYAETIDPSLDGEVALGSIFVAAKLFNAMPAEIFRRLERFVPFGVKLPRINAETLDQFEMSETNWRLMSRDLDSRFPWITAPAPLVHLTRAARKLDRPLSDILTMAVRLGIAPDKLRPHAEALGNAPPDENDEILCRSFDSIDAPDAATAFERGKERARYRLWYLSQEQFEARLERLRPMIEISLKNRFRRHQPPSEA